MGDFESEEPSSNQASGSYFSFLFFIFFFCNLSDFYYSFSFRYYAIKVNASNERRFDRSTVIFKFCVRIKLHV